MKRVIKELLTTLYTISPEQVISEIEKTDCGVVSFDIFDTLIKRNVPTPQEVFLLLEQRYQKYFTRNIPVYTLRSQAEKRAARNTGHKEVSFQEIYHVMEELTEQQREWLMAEEIHIERTVCQRWQPMGRVYDWCIKEGIPVILVSDMYLPREVITDILRAAGYTGWKRLYISAEEHANKANGTLFNVVLNMEQLKPGELLHIGDSLRGDYWEPRKKHIEAILVRSY